MLRWNRLHPSEIHRAPQVRLDRTEVSVRISRGAKVLQECESDTTCLSRLQTPLVVNAWKLAYLNRIGTVFRSCRWGVAKW